MYSNLGTLLPLSLGIAINPVSIVAIILLLTSYHGRTKGLAYLAGWIVGLMTLVFAIGLLVSSWTFRRSPTGDQFTTWVLFIVTVILILMACVQWLQRPPPDAEAMPIMWLREMPHATSFMALSAGLFFGLFNMKNLLLTAVAVLLIGEVSFGLDQRMRMVILFVAFATSGIAVPVVVSLTQNGRSQAILADWESKLAIHNVTISCAVLVIIALQLLLIGLGRL